MNASLPLLTSASPPGPSKGVSLPVYRPGHMCFMGEQDWPYKTPAGLQLLAASSGHILVVTLVTCNFKKSIRF